MPIIDFSLVVNADQDEVFAFLSDMANIHLWDKTLHVVVPPAGTLAIDEKDSETVIVRDCSGFFHDMGALGGTKGMLMRYTISGWEKPNWLVIGGTPSLATAAIARRITLRFEPGPDPATTTIQYEAEVALPGPLQVLSFVTGKAARDTADAIYDGLEAAFRMKKFKKLIPAEGSNEEQRSYLRELAEAHTELADSLEETKELVQEVRRRSAEHRRYCPETSGSLLDYGALGDIGSTIVAKVVDSIGRFGAPPQPPRTATAAPAPAPAAAANPVPVPREEELESAGGGGN